MNKHLLHDLTDMGLWCPALKNKIIYANGSVQNIAEIPDDLRAIYKYDKFFSLAFLLPFMLIVPSNSFFIY